MNSVSTSYRAQLAERQRVIESESMTSKERTGARLDHTERARPIQSENRDVDHRIVALETEVAQLRAEISRLLRATE